MFAQKNIRNGLRSALFTAAAAFALFAATPALAQLCPYNSTQASCACPTSGGGTTCFGGQLYRSTDGSCQNDPRLVAGCGASQQFNCATVACQCTTGTTLCASSGVCVTNRVCAAGLTWDVCTDSCTTPYVLLSPASAQTGGIKVTGDFSSSGGDLYLSNGKAIRVDGAGATALNVGNWGGGTFSLCLNGDCKAAWPSTTDFNPIYVNTAGDTMTGDLRLSGATSDMLVDGNVGVGTATPTSKLDVIGTAKMIGFQLTTGAVAGRVLTSDASGNGTWQAVAAIGGSGTASYVPKFATATTLGDSIIYDTGVTVGIGTTNPTFKLDVAGGNIHVASGTNFTSVWSDRATTAQFAVTSYATAGAGQWDIGLVNNGTNDFNFRNFSGSNVVTVQQGGSVGIGTPSPSSRLDVAGTVEMTGFLLPTGAVSGRVLTSDASGNGTWQVVAAPVNSVSGSGAGISVGPTTGNVVVTNTGVTSLAAGTGISVSPTTGASVVSNTGVTSLVAGTDNSVSAATGSVAVNNTSTLQTVTNRGATTNKSINAGSNVAFYGIEGQAATTGVSGFVWGNFGQAVVGNALNVASGTGVNGGGTGTGVFGNSPSGTGVSGQGGATGVYGTGTSYGGNFAGGTYGVRGSGSSSGVYGTSGLDGVVGIGATGVYGQGSNNGVAGNGGTYGGNFSGTSYGVYGSSSNSAGFFYNPSYGTYGQLGYGGYSLYSYGTLLNMGNATITGALSSANLSTGGVYSSNYIQAAYDLIAENNSWGSGSGWIQCPAGGYYCNCPNGSFVSDLYDAGGWMYCRKP